MTPKQHQELIKAQIARSFNENTPRVTDQELEQSADTFLEKGGKRAVVGEKRMFGGREYIKTMQGWKFHGKGTGAKAQEHAAGSQSTTPKVLDKKSPTLRELDESKNGTVYYKGIKTRAVFTSYGMWHVNFPTDSNEEDFRIKGGENVNLNDFEIKTESAPKEEVGKVGKSDTITLDKDHKGIERKALDYIDRAGKALAEKATPDQITTLRDFAKKHGAESGMSNKEIDDAIIAAREKHTPKKEKKEEVSKSYALSSKQLNRVQSLNAELSRLDKIERMYSKDQYLKQGGDKEKQYRKERDELLTMGDMSPFIMREGFSYYLSPGPMKISPDHHHEEYSFDVTGRDSKEGYSFKIKSEKEIQADKESRKGTLEGIKGGKVVWFTPGGYHFAVMFKKTDQGNTAVSIQGRPSSAVGKSPQFEEYEVKGWDINSQRKELAKFDSIEKVQSYMQKFNGKTAKYV